jgi:hypothetical protein
VTGTRAESPQGWGWAAGLDPVMANALEREGYTLERLSGLGLTDGQQWPPGCWIDLMEMRNIGPRRLLKMVNHLRKAGTELQWFANFHWATEFWEALEGCERVPPPEGATVGPPQPEPSGCEPIAPGGINDVPPPPARFPLSRGSRFSLLDSSTGRECVLVVDDVIVTATAGQGRGMSITSVMLAVRET